MAVADLCRDSPVSRYGGLLAWDDVWGNSTLFATNQMHWSVWLVIGFALAAVALVFYTLSTPYIAPPPH
jgi:hypothetical protein